MKRDRDSYFGQYSQYGYNNSPYIYPNNQNLNYESMIENRLNKIEKELANINNRLLKLEQSNNSGNDYNFANSMYMV